MKKSLTLLFSLYLLLVNLQPSLAMHYCQGSLVSVKLVTGDGHTDCTTEYSYPSEKALDGGSYKPIPCCQDALQKLAVDEYTSGSRELFEISSINLPEDLLSFIIDSSSGLPYKFRFRTNSLVSLVSLPAIGVFRL